MNGVDSEGGAKPLISATRIVGELPCRQALRSIGLLTVALHGFLAWNSAQADLSLSELTASGRPANLFTQAAAPPEEYKAQCDDLLRSLNEPTLAPGTDIRSTLLHSSFSVDWTKEHLDDLTANLGLSELRTAEVRVPQGNYDVADFSNLIHDRLQDEAFVISSGLKQLREKSGLLGKRFLGHLKDGADPDVHRIVTQPLWRSEVANRTTSDAESIVPLSGDAYWFDVVLIAQTPLALVTPPVGFNSDGTLRRKFEVFALALHEQGLGSKVCHFTTHE